MKKYLTAILIMTVIVGALVGVMLYKAEKYRQLSSQLTARQNLLEIDVIEKQKQIKALKFTISGLNQELEQTTIKYQADEMYIQDLETATTHMAAYINYVNLVLTGSGIEIPDYIMGYVTETGKVVKSN